MNSQAGKSKTDKPRLKVWIGGILTVLLLAAMTGGLVFANVPAGKSQAPVYTNPAVQDADEFEAAGSDLWPVHIRQPDGPPAVATGRTNLHGESVTVSCGTCHANSTPNPNVRRAEELDEFHQGLTYDHGNLSCLSCHHPDNYDALRLADGNEVAFQQVMDLCAQCHGPQARDYRNGSHGGMTGYWDRTRGPQHRNNCIDCHDPHHPKYPQVMPVFAPRDRLGDANH